VAEFGQIKNRQVRSQSLGALGVSDNEARAYLADDILRERGRACGVERHCKHASQYATEEDADPVSGIFSPKNNALPGSDAPSGQLGGESACDVSELSVGCRVASDTAMYNHRDLIAVAAEVVYEAGEMSSHAR
jgi:hypothetical protein